MEGSKRKMASLPLRNGHSLTSPAAVCLNEPFQNASNGFIKSSRFQSTQDDHAV